jgi:transketolase
VALAREKLGWKYPPFEIPKEIYQQWDAVRAAAGRTDVEQRFAAYQQQYPELAAELKRRMDGALPENWGDAAHDYIAQLQAEPAKIASRKASQNALNAYGPLLPELLGGSADLAPSNLTIWSGSTSIKEDGGNYIHYGVREFGMTAIGNGIALTAALSPIPPPS